MRLSKTNKYLILEKIYIDKFKKDYDELVNDLKKWLVNEFEKQNKDLIDIFDKLSSVDQGAYVSYIKYSARFSLCRSLDEVDKLSFGIVLHNSKIDGYIECKKYASSYYLSFKDDKELKNRIKEFNKDKQVFVEKLTQINNVLQSCATVERLIKLVPEFEEYTPKQITNVGLIPIDQIKEVSFILSQQKEGKI
jgi:hypothetical protein